MIRATLPKRGQDAWGSGAFGASRGTRSHKGIDYCCYPDTAIESPVDGTVTKLGYPYSDDLSFRYVEVTDSNKYRHRLFYVAPLVVKGEEIIAGKIVGTAQDIAGRYRDESKPAMTNHVHYEILDTDKTPVNPEEF